MTSKIDTQKELNKIYNRFVIGNDNSSKSLLTHELSSESHFDIKELIFALNQELNLGLIENDFVNDVMNDDFELTAFLKHMQKSFLYDKRQATIFIRVFTPEQKKLIENQYNIKLYNWYFPIPLMGIRKEMMQDYLTVDEMANKYHLFTIQLCDHFDQLADIRHYFKNVLPNLTMKSLLKLALSQSELRVKLDSFKIRLLFDVACLNHGLIVDKRLYDLNNLIEKLTDELVYFYNSRQVWPKNLEAPKLSYIHFAASELASKIDVIKLLYRYDPLFYYNQNFSHLYSAVEVKNSERPLLAKKYQGLLEAHELFEHIVDYNFSKLPVLSNSAFACLHMNRTIEKDIHISESHSIASQKNNGVIDSSSIVSNNSISESISTNESASKSLYSEKNQDKFSNTISETKLNGSSGSLTTELPSTVNKSPLSSTVADFVDSVSSDIATNTTKSESLDIRHSLKATKTSQNGAHDSIAHSSVHSAKSARVFKDDRDATTHYDITDDSKNGVINVTRKNEIKNKFDEHYVNPSSTNDSYNYANLSVSDILARHMRKNNK